MAETPQTNSPLKPYGDVVVATGKYVKDGKERNRYQKIGTLFATPHFSRITIKLDAAPITGEGWLSVFPREKQESTADEVHEVDENEPISLDDIPL